MVVKTKLFGEIDVAEDKIIRFPNGIIGFPGLQKFLLIYDSEKEDGNISWLQSLDELAFAMPVVDPLLLIPDYDPHVEDELLTVIGDIKQEDMLVLVTLTVPTDITKMTANLKGPIVINAGNQTACQLIIEDDDYAVRHPIYELLKSRKGE